MEFSFIVILKLAGLWDCCQTNVRKKLRVLYCWLLVLDTWVLVQVTEFGCFLNFPCAWILVTQWNIILTIVIWNFQDQKQGPLNKKILRKTLATVVTYNFFISIWIRVTWNESSMKFETGSNRNYLDILVTLFTKYSSIWLVNRAETKWFHRTLLFTILYFPGLFRGFHYRACNYFDIVSECMSYPDILVNIAILIPVLSVLFLSYVLVVVLPFDYLGKFWGIPSKQGTISEPVGTCLTGS